MQHICLWSSGHVGELLGPLTCHMVADSSCIVKLDHNIMWLICFINIPRMFQFPPVNRILDSKLWNKIGDLTSLKTLTGFWKTRLDLVKAVREYITLFLLSSIFRQLGLKIYHYSCFGFFFWFYSGWPLGSFLTNHISFCSIHSIKRAITSTWVCIPKEVASITSRINKITNLLIFPEVRF